MKPYAPRLTPVLTENAPSFSLAIPDLNRDLRGAFGALRMTGRGTAELRVGHDSWEAVVGRDLRGAIGDAGDMVVWVLDADVLARTGTACLVRPPRRAVLSVSIPVHVPPSLSDVLVVGGALHHTGVVDVAGRRVAFLAQPMLALGGDDACSPLIWWLPDGDAVALELREQGGQAWLEATAFHRRAGRDATLGRPGVMLEIADKGGVPLVHASADGANRVALSTVRDLWPPKSDLLSAWTAYAAAKRKRSGDQDEARGRHPIQFIDAQVKDGGWVVRANLDSDAMTAWLGEDHKEGREVRINQPARLESPDRTVDLQTMVRLGPTAVVITLKVQGATDHLPDSGTLRAKDNHGALVDDKRKRGAVQVLERGLAACPTLPGLLRHPATALPPNDIARLPRTPREPLDRSQEHAVKLIMGCRDMVAIQGPPGTGKTRVIVEALEQIAESHSGKAPIRILISSVQNEAVQNVAERLSSSALFVRSIQRRARDADEERMFAAGSESLRNKVIEQLRGSLAGYDDDAHLSRIAEVEAHLNAIRTAHAAESARRVLEGLFEVATVSDGLLPEPIVEEAGRLAKRVEATLNVSDVPAQVAIAMSPPQSPEEAGEWQAQHLDRICTDEHARLRAALLLVTKALELSESPRRDRKLRGAWHEYLDIVAHVLVSSGQETVAVTPDAGQDVDSWCVTALEILQGHRRTIEQQPSAIALRFLRALETDPLAWKRIEEAHATTIAATCSMSAKATRAPEEPYDWVIIDEAGRADPVELLVPMVQGKRIVLIGDHRQLPPMIDDAVVKQAELGEGGELQLTSLFGEIIERLPVSCKTRLGTQYRMHGEIGSLVDATYYRPNGEPLDSHFAGVRAAQRQSRLGVLGDRPLAWVDVSGAGQCTEENETEAALIVNLLERYATAGAGAGSIAVICPYGKQRKRIESLLSGRPELHRVAQVRTIDAVQGREWPIVIVGIVRSDGRSGFLASPNRMNVAISRAQKQLVVVGALGRLQAKRDRLRHAPELLRLVDALMKCEVTL
jgi:hypothetical protein